MADPCLICGEPVDDRSLACNVCRTVPTARLVEHGFTLDVEDQLGQRGGSTLSVSAPLHITSGLAVALSRENIGHRFKKLFADDELQVGDAEFDDRVYVEFGEAEDIEAFQDPWVQELVLKLTSAGRLTVTENHASLRIDVPTTSLTADEIDLGLALLISVLNRIRRRRYG